MQSDIYFHIFSHHHLPNLLCLKGLGLILFSIVLEAVTFFKCTTRAAFGIFRDKNTARHFPVPLLVEREGLSCYI